MLTKEEKNEIIDVYMQDDGCSIHDMCEAIERAVLAKAMPIPKQEPIYMWQMDGDEGWIVCTKEWFDDIKHTNETRIVYAKPQPSQAAAIPDGLCIDENLKRLALDYVRCGIGANYSRESFEDRMREIYYPFRKIIDLIPLSTSPRPE